MGFTGKSSLLKPGVPALFEEESKERCPDCSQPLTFVRTKSHERRWYCYSCEKYVDSFAEAASPKDVSARLDALLTFPGQFKKVLTNLRVGEPVTANGKDVQVIQGDGPDGVVASLYFDEKTGLLVRTIRYGRSPIGRVSTQVDYDDYRDVSGIKIPFKYTFAWLDGRDSFELSNVRINAPIDAAKFERQSR